MIFVIGPLFSGKQDYIMQALGWSETDFLEKAVRDVQNLAAEAAEAVETSHSPLDDLQEKLRSLADRLSQKEVVIATETGCGVIPLDPRERRNREAAGRLSCLLAERAETVVRVCCGIPQVLKGSCF
jgi:adenosyl cobinamide kinase/adenosyl cobinamide phosphate guanylyltransferase